MVKLTKRKGFNFFRSYFDVYNELSNEDKVKFMDALLDRQFLGIKPTKLEGMASFAYISQTNSIDSQVRGYEDKTKTKLSPPCVGGAVGGLTTPPLQVEEEVQEKVEEQINNIYEKFIDEVGKKGFATRIEALYMRLKIREGTLTPLLKEFKLHIIEENREHKTTNDYFINFKNWLNTQDRIKKLDKYR